MTNDYYFAIFNRVCMLKSCSMFDKLFRLFVLFNHICLKMFLSTCSIKNCLYWRRFFYKIWWHVKQLHVKFSISFCCQCKRDISKIINFCFTIAHEICDNKLIKSFINLKLSMFYLKFVNMFLSQLFIDQIEKFAHYQYYWRSRLMHSRKQKRNYSQN